MAAAVLLAAGSAFLAALAVVLQRVALESAPAARNLTAGLMVHALRKRGWLAGFGLMLAAFVVQASALRAGQLAVVQPVLPTELVFLVGILVVVFRRRVGWRELAGIGGIIAGLAGFFASSSPAAGTGQPAGLAWDVAAGGAVACAALLVAVGRTGPRWWRAGALGSAAAVLFAYNAALTKTVTALLRDGGWSAVFGNAAPYLLAATGAAGLFVLQSALHAGPITASRTANVIVNPLVSIVIGVTAFGERLRAGALFVAVDVVAIGVLCAGVVILVRSPLVAGIGGAAGDEFLTAGAAARTDLAARPSDGTVTGTDDPAMPQQA